MMNREELRAYAAGKYVLSNPHFDADKMNSFVEGALMCADYYSKKKADAARDGEKEINKEVESKKSFNNL